jgi:hypothetical protein
MESRVVIFVVLHRKRFSEGIPGLTIFGSQENRGKGMFLIFLQMEIGERPGVLGLYQRGLGGEFAHGVT